MIGLIVFIIIVVLAVVLLVQYLVAREFYNVAISKGYDDQKYLIIPFLLGIAGYLLVIALPNKKTVNDYVERKNSKPIFVDKKDSKPIFVDIKDRPVSRDEWKCPQCGNIHANYVGTCGCGQKKPR